MNNSSNFKLFLIKSEIILGSDLNDAFDGLSDVYDCYRHIHKLPTCPLVTIIYISYAYSSVYMTVA